MIGGWACRAWRPPCRLGRRGYDVALAEATTADRRGRVLRENRLPGLSAWGRVKDYRDYQIGQMPNVQTYLDSRLDAEQVLEFGFQNVCIATGSQSGGAMASPAGMSSRCRWRRMMPVFTPDDLMAGKLPAGSVDCCSMTTTSTWAAYWPSCLVQNGCRA